MTAPETAGAEGIRTEPRTHASTLGEFSGTEALETLTLMRGELGHPHTAALPVLPERGFAATLMARTIACLEELHADGQAVGWRLTRRPARESTAARSLLRSDINLLADVVGQEERGHRGSTVVDLLGPLTLSARIRLGHGESAVSDAGARRDLLESLVAGLPELVGSLRRAVGEEELNLRFREPALAEVLGGRIRTSSGLSRWLAVPRPEAEAGLHLLAQRCHELGVGAVLDARAEDARGGDAAPQDSGRARGRGLRAPAEDSRPSRPRPTGLPVPELCAPFDGLGAGTRGIGASGWESLADAVESGKTLWLGLTPVSPRDQVASAARRFWRTWRDLGLGETELRRVVVQEDRSLADVDAATARATLARSAALAEAMRETAMESMP